MVKDEKIELETFNPDEAFEDGARSGPVEAGDEG